jgi:hypothetical protein
MRIETTPFLEPFSSLEGPKAKYTLNQLGKPIQKKLLLY